MKCSRASFPILSDFSDTATDVTEVDHVKCPYCAIVMEFLGGPPDNDEPGYWCPGCEKTFMEGDPELPNNNRSR